MEMVTGVGQAKYHNLPKCRLVSKGAEPTNYAINH